MPAIALAVNLCDGLRCAGLEAVDFHEFSVVAEQEHALPTIDLSEDTARQIVIAQGTPEQYQGHPTTVLLPDGKTMYCVWTINHGGPCGPMKRSDDGGLSWSPLLKVPSNWSDVENCPAIYRLQDPRGVARLVVYALGREDKQMHRAYSKDDGQTWTPMEPIGIQPSVMPFCTIISVDEGQRLLGMTNLRRPGETEEVRSNILAQSFSSDGGLTWSPWEIVQDVEGLKVCEPEVIRSPDGKQLLCFIRENNRKSGSLYMTSEDEGRTWSAMRPLPPGLHGDRHKASYSDDGRLVVVFRDMGNRSPTKSHFVAWIGKYEDILTGRDSEYRLKLLHSHKGHDCGYPGLERLPDGTFVATTYVKYRPGPEKNSVVSVRFRLDETDSMASSSAARTLFILLGWQALARWIPVAYS